MILKKFKLFCTLTCWLTKTMAYKDKPLKLRNVTSLKITHLKYYGDWISLTYSSRPLIPSPPLKRLVKAVRLRSAKSRCGAPYVRGGLDLKRFDHILIREGGGTGTKKKSAPIPVL